MLEARDPRFLRLSSKKLRSIRDRMDDHIAVKGRATRSDTTEIDGNADVLLDSTWQTTIPYQATREKGAYAVFHACYAFVEVTGVLSGSTL